MIILIERAGARVHEGRAHSQGKGEPDRSWGVQPFERRVPFWL